MEGTVQVGVILQGLIALGVTVTLGISGWALKRIICVDKKLDRLEEWRDGHEKQDDERHKENLGRFDALVEAVNKKRG